LELFSIFTSGLPNFRLGIQVVITTDARFVLIILDISVLAGAAREG